MKVKQTPANSVVRNSQDGFGIRVQPRDSVPSSDIANNAAVNLGLMPRDAWVSKCSINRDTAWIISAGPSLDRLLRLGYLRPEWFAEGTGNVIFTVKHALPVLAKYGLEPHYCVVLDPRPIQGVSTHGYLRETLYNKAPKSTKFLVASMTHPSVTRWLIKSGYNIFGWHSAANGLVTPQKDLEKGTPPGPLQNHRVFIQGGTCSATRSISLCHFLGFRRVNLVAFDSNLAGPPDNPDYVEEVDGQKVKKFWETSIGNSRKFYTTGELIAQLQDLEAFITDEIPDVEINIIGADKDSSLVGALAETVPNKTYLRSYKEQLKI